MKSRHVSMFMMTVTIAYSAPIEYEYETIEVETPRILRQALDNPGKCCSDKSQRCCPYDYDDRCETTNNRTLCGYNKNQKKTDTNEFITKFGLPCRINDDRLECGYNGPYRTDVTDPMTNTPAIPSGCCNCCTAQTTKPSEIATTAAATVTLTEPATEITIESTTSMPKTTKSSIATTEYIPDTTLTMPETTEGSPDTTEYIETTEKITKTSFKKLDFKSTTMSPPAPECVEVEEKCHIVYEQPCIMDPPCQNDFSE